MKTTLYRFASYRNHQRIDDEVKSKYYVNASEVIISGMYFLDGLSSGDYNEVVEQIQTKSNYNGLLSIIDIKQHNKYSKLLLLSNAINQNLISTDFNNIKELGITSNSKLTETQETKIWDNLLHALLIKRYKAKVDILLSILVANNFLLNFDRSLDYSLEHNTYEITRLKRLIKAKVILPINIIKKTPDPSPKQLTKSQKNVLLDQHSLMLSKIEIRRIDRLRKNIRLISIEGFPSTIKEEQKVESKKKLDEINNDKKYKELSSETKKRIEKDIIAKNENVSQPLLSRGRVSSVDYKSKLESPRDKLLFEKLLPTKTSLLGINTILSSHIKETISTSIPIRTCFSTMIQVNGFQITLKPKPANNSFVITTKSVGDKFDIFITQYFRSEESAIIEIKGNITFGDATPDVGLIGERLIASSKPNYITYKLNAEPFKILRKDQPDEIRITYRTHGNVLDDVTEKLEKVRLIYPVYGILQILPDKIVLPERTPMYGITNLGISDFRRVDQEVVCYSRGEVSHIENIMASEYKEKTSRSFMSTESSEESESITETELVSDTTTTDRFEMQSEVTEVLNSEKSKELSLGFGVSGTYPGSGINFNVDTSGSFSSSSSKEESSSIAITQAKEVTEQVKDRIFSKVTKKRSYRMKKEFEETNKHGFDNRLNPEHVVGIYRWIDKIFENKLVNYGRRLNYEFMIAEPGRNFLQSLVDDSEPNTTVSSSNSNIQLIQVPNPPSDILGDETNYINITEEELYQAAALYGAEIPNKPDPEVAVTRAFSMVIRESGSLWKTDDSAAFNELQVPDGYLCQQIEMEASYIVHGGDEGIASARVIVGSQAFDLNPNNHQTKNIPPTEGTISVSYRTRDVGAMAISVTALCKLKDSIWNKWKIDSYNSIMAAYQKKLDAFNEQERYKEQNEEEIFTPEKKEYNYNPQINRNIEKTELKRLCIEMMLNQFNINISSDSYKTNPIGQVPMLNLNESYDLKAKRVDFLEQAFEWDIMAYKFFPYFYSDEDKWHELMHINGTVDEIFKAFLSSGMAKVKLPVRRGFENAVQFFLRTGETWLGSGFVLDGEDDLDISINEEIDTGQEEVVIEKTWRTRIPTTLTIVQKDSGAIDHKGLDCVSEDGTEGKIEGTDTSSKLIGEINQEAEEATGVGEEGTIGS